MYQGWPFANLPHFVRLDILDLTSLARIRIISDLIQIFKIINKIDKIVFITPMVSKGIPGTIKYILGKLLKQKHIQVGYVLSLIKLWTFVIAYLRKQ